MKLRKTIDPCSSSKCILWCIKYLTGFSEAILQKKRKEILEKKIDFYKDLVKGLMGDKDIQEELMENPEIELDEFQHLQA